MQVSAAIVADPNLVAASSTVSGDGNNAVSIAGLEDQNMYASASQVTATDPDSGDGDDPAATAVINNVDQAYKATTGSITLQRGADSSTWSIESDGGYTGLSVLSASANTLTLDLIERVRYGGDVSTLDLTGTWNQGDTLSFNLEPDATTPTISGEYSALTGIVGQDASNASNSLTQQTTITNQLQTQQASVSGVSLDEEMMNLMKYQAAYGAAGELASVVSDLMDTLINTVK